MDNIQSSIESLIKTNNGFFKSEKQATFLIAMINNDQAVYVGSTYGNSFTISYQYDEKGITVKEQYNSKTSTTQILWQRKIKGEMTLAETKLLKSYKRNLTKTKKILAEREQARAEYPQWLAQYGQSMLDMNEENIQSHIADIEYLQDKINEIMDNV